MLVKSFSVLYGQSVFVGFFIIYTVTKMHTEIGKKKQGVPKHRRSFTKTDYFQ